MLNGILLYRTDFDIETVLTVVYKSKQFYSKQFSLAWVRSLNIKTVLFQVIQVSISPHFCYISPIDRALSGASTPDPSEPSSDSNDWVLRIPQSSSITGTSPTDCFISYFGHLLEEGVLPLWSEAVCVFYSRSRLGKHLNGFNYCHLTRIQIKIDHLFVHS